MHTVTPLYYIQYNQKLKHGKEIKGVSFYLLKFIQTLIFRWYFPTNHLQPSSTNHWKVPPKY